LGPPGNYLFQDIFFFFIISVSFFWHSTKSHLQSSLFFLHFLVWNHSHLFSFLKILSDLFASQNFIHLLSDTLFPGALTLQKPCSIHSPPPPTFALHLRKFFTPLFLLKLFHLSLFKGHHFPLACLQPSYCLHFPISWYTVLFHHEMEAASSSRTLVLI
jgi:hypothetical protein